MAIEPPMDTQDLIKKLAQEHEQDAPAPRHHRLAWVTTSALAAVIVIALIGDFLFQDIRPHLESYLLSHTYAYKVLICIAILLPGISLYQACSTPGRRPNTLILIIGVLALLLSAGIGVISTTLHGIPDPVSARTPIICAVSIATIAIINTGVLLTAMKKAVITRPMLSGSACGLLSSGTTAIVYTLFCRNDAPPLITLGYLLPAILCAALGAILGRTFLRW